MVLLYLFPLLNLYLQPTYFTLQFTPFDFKFINPLLIFPYFLLQPLVLTLQSIILFLQPIILLTNLIILINQLSILLLYFLDLVLHFITIANTLFFVHFILLVDLYSFLDIANQTIFDIFQMLNIDNICIIHVPTIYQLNNLHFFIINLLLNM